MQTESAVDQGNYVHGILILARKKYKLPGGSLSIEYTILNRAFLSQNNSKLTHCSNIFDRSIVLITKDRNMTVPRLNYTHHNPNQ